MQEKKDWENFCALVSASDSAGGVVEKRNEMALAMMFEALDGYDFDEVRAAIANHMKTSKYILKVADIVEYLDGDIDTQARKAWNAILQAARRYGGSTSVFFDDPAIHYFLQETGGWIEFNELLNSTPREEVEFRFKPFKEVYRDGVKCASFAKEPGKFKVKPYFLGLYDRDNTANGYLKHVKPPVNALTGESWSENAIVAR